VSAVRWIEEPAVLGATVNPVQWHWRANCYDACLEKCIEEHGGVDVPLVSDLCASKCYDDSGCAALPYQTRAEYQVATGKTVPVDPVVSACAARAANRETCRLVCEASGFFGLPICADFCLDQLCTAGFVITPKGAQAVLGKVGPCLTKCFADANALSNPSARAAALAACQSTCNLAAALAALPPSERSPVQACPSGQILVGGKCSPISGSKTEPAKFSAARSSWLPIAVVAAAVAAVALAGRS
jgi:hypothetical protein